MSILTKEGEELYKGFVLRVAEENLAHDSYRYAYLYDPSTAEIRRYLAWSTSFGCDGDTVRVDATPELLDSIRPLFVPYIAERVKAKRSLPVEIGDQVRLQIGRRQVLGTVFWLGRVRITHRVGVCDSKGTKWFGDAMRAHRTDYTTTIQEEAAALARTLPTSELCSYLCHVPAPARWRATA
jgi:hypothetical protein